MLKKVVLGCCLLALFFGCTSNEESSSSSSNQDDFDRSAMLVNWADNIIIPAYQDLEAKLETLHTNKNTFNTTPNQANLDNLRASWLSAYKVWQSVAMFEIGKAEELGLLFEMNVFPTDSANIEANISNGNYDLSHPNNDDAVGFPALDYMLYGLANDDASILAKYNDDAYKTYLSDLIDRMVSMNSLVLNDWTSGYRDEFVSRSGNAVTSSVNKIANDFIFQYEKLLRAKKFGVPAGVFSGSNQFPEKVEGFYSKIYSKELALDAIQVTQDFFVGKAYNQSTTSTSFVSYLNYLNRADLVATISDRFNNASIKIEQLNNNFYQQVISDNIKMTQTYDVIQSAIVPLKVDMMQAFNISFDFIDNDGD